MTEDSILKQEKDSLLTEYWTFHPRYRFFKTSALNSRVLDVGAGTGGLHFRREWGFPKRNDIELHAVDLKKGEFFDFFSTFQIMDLEKDELHYAEDFFDAMTMSHCLEHIEKGDVVLSKLRKRLKPHGQLYIEMPTPESRSFPLREYYLKQGLNVCVTSFGDDKTHVKTYTFQELFSILNHQHFAVVEFGIIENKYLEDLLFKWGSENSDQEITTYAIWLKLRFAQYCIAERLE